MAEESHSLTTDMAHDLSHVLAGSTGVMLATSTMANALYAHYTVAGCINPPESAVMSRNNHSPLQSIQGSFLGGTRRKAT